MSALLAGFAVQRFKGLIFKEVQRRKTITKKAAELSSLHDVGMAITSILDLDELLDKVLQAVVDNLGYDRAMIVLVDEEKGVLTSGRGVVGTEEMIKFVEKLEIPVAEDMGVLPRVARSGSSILISDVKTTNIDINIDLVRALRTESFLAVPLKTREKVTGVIAVDCSKSGIKLSESDESLLNTFAVQVAISVENTRLVEEVAEKERIRHELEVARNIQEGLLPQTDPQIPGFELVGKSIPADEVGGDFYNYYQIEDGKLGIVIGDVSGKGISAAMLMAVISGIIDSEVKESASAAEFIKSVNLLLIPRAKPSKMNSALLYVILDSRGKKFKVANAGEIAPLLCKHDGGECDYLDVKGFPVGMTTIGKYEERELELESGDMVVLSSDGIVEAMNEHGKMYGFDRFKNAILKYRGLSAPDLVAKILEEVKDFVGEGTSQDDTTIVVLKTL